MKTKALIILLLVQITVFATTEKEVNSKIEKVNVFLTRAEIYRQASVLVNEGIIDVILTDLSDKIDPNSVQVTSKGDAVIMSVKHQINYLNKAEKSDKIKQLEAQKNLLEDENLVIRYKKEALNEEKSLILANKQVGGANSGVNWEQLENIADLYRERLVDISAKWTALDKTQKQNTIKFNEVVNQIKNLTTSLNKPTSEIIVKIKANKTHKIELLANYMVNNAGWTPLYDFRAQDGSEKIAVDMKANVYQNTGVDWSNVPLTLSTGNPILGVTKPELNPWYLHLITLQQLKSKRSAYYGNAPERAKQEVYFDASTISATNRMDEDKEISLSSFVHTNMKQLSTEYQIQLNQTVFSDNKMYMVNVKRFEVNAQFNHASVPKLDKDAFLMANITDWQSYDWITSEMNIFYDGTFVGTSLLDVAQVDDTLSLSLGRDKKVVITREKIKDYCSTKSFGLSKRKLIGYEITIRNNKKMPIQINLQDQIPVSQSEQIEVKVVDVSKANLNEVNGFLDWIDTIKPGETKKYNVKFEIKYPKKYTVSNL